MFFGLPARLCYRLLRGNVSKTLTKKPWHCWGFVAVTPWRAFRMFFLTFGGGKMVVEVEAWSGAGPSGFHPKKGLGA